MLHIPLALEAPSEVKELNNQILFLLGDKLYQRRGDRYSNLDVDVPEPLASNECLGQAPQTESASFGSIISFRKNGSFALLSFSEQQDEFCYRLSSMAGWHKYGNKNHLEKYWSAFDVLLEELGALAESYKYSCPCGHREVISGGHTTIQTHVNEHLATDHTKDRISNSTLIGQEVTRCSGSKAIDKPISRTASASQSI
jgi:hypothetical protein